MARRKNAKPKAKKAETVTVPLLVQTNLPNPHKDALLKFVYHAAQKFQIGYMDGMDPDTGDIVPLLVLIEATDDKRFDVRPIARLLSRDEDAKEYLVPDGQGNYHQLSTCAPETGSRPADERVAPADGERTH